MPKFRKLNELWNAEPNSPDPEVRIVGRSVELRFKLNHMIHEAYEEEIAVLAFSECPRWRLGPTNDEGWYRGQCRYVGLAPAWGEFYEIIGEDRLALYPNDWNVLSPLIVGRRHFLFYLRDETFECFALDCVLRRGDDLSKALPIG